jgi:hypothetical protein
VEHPSDRWAVVDAIGQLDAGYSDRAIVADCRLFDENAGSIEEEVLTDLQAGFHPANEDG